jgi:hypothetical protein
MRALPGGRPDIFRKGPQIMTFFSDHIFRAVTEAPVSRPQNSAERATGLASLWPDIATFVVFGLASPLMRAPRTPESRESMVGMDDRSPNS